MMSSSSATVSVEKATSELLNGPDWTLNIEICDSINANQWLAKDVIKAVKKRLQHKSPRVHFYALILLETLIKNCGEYVHLQVAEREILQDMVKIVKKKTDMQVRDKILVLLDSWQEAFGGPQGKYPQYYWAYIELKRSGIQFPRRSPDAAPIFTPPITHPMPRPPVGYGMPSNSSMRLDEAMASEMGKMSRSDLESIQRAMEVLSDMLQAINPNDREAVKDELIVDLLKQCRTDQKKLMQLVTSTSDEELLAQGLALNDNLQYLIAKHDAVASGSPLPTNPNPKPSTPPAPVASAAGIHEAEEEDDGFSQLARRESKGKSVPSQSSPVEAGNGVISSGKSDPSATEEASFTSMSSALVPVDPPTQAKIETNEQDLIDLLSITLSTNPSPPVTQPTETPITQPSAFQETGSQVPAFQPQGNPYNHQTYTTNQGYPQYNSYVVPWAQNSPQPVPQPQFPQYPYPSTYYVPHWATQPNSTPNGFPVAVNQYPASQTSSSNENSPMNARPQLSNQNSFAPVGSNPTSRTLQQQNSFGSRINNPEQRSTLPASAPGNKPFIPSYRLFEDLIDLRTSDKTKTSSSSPISGLSRQNIISDRK